MSSSYISWQDPDFSVGMETIYVAIEERFWVQRFHGPDVWALYSIQLAQKPAQLDPAMHGLLQPADGARTKLRGLFVGHYRTPLVALCLQLERGFFSAFATPPNKWQRMKQFHAVLAYHAWQVCNRDAILSAGIDIATHKILSQVCSKAGQQNPLPRLQRISPWLNGYWVYLYYYVQSAVEDPRYPEDTAKNTFLLSDKMHFWGRCFREFACYGMFAQISTQCSTLYSSRRVDWKGLEAYIRYTAPFLLSPEVRNVTEKSPIGPCPPLLPKDATKWLPKPRFTPGANGDWEATTQPTVNGDQIRAVLDIALSAIRQSEKIIFVIGTL